MAFTLKMTLQFLKIIICLVYYPNSEEFKGYKMLFYRKKILHYEIIIVPLQTNLVYY